VLERAVERKGEGTSHTLVHMVKCMPCRLAGVGTPAEACGLRTGHRLVRASWKVDGMAGGFVEEDESPVTRWRAGVVGAVGNSLRL